MKKRVTALCLVVVLVMGLAACGGSGKGLEDATYGTIYDSNTDAAVLEAMPENQFLLDDARKGIADGKTFEITLLLESNGDYTLIMHLYNPAQTDTNASDYLEIRVGLIGTYSKDGDTVTLQAAEMGDASFYAGADYAEAYKSFSFAEDGSNGDFYFDETPAMADLVPEGSKVMVSGTAVTGWEIGK